MELFKVHDAHASCTRTLLAKVKRLMKLLKIFSNDQPVVLVAQDLRLHKG